MRKMKKSSRFISLLLVLAMVMTYLPFGALAATEGDLAAGDTGLSTDIDTKDIISLPIKIYDYQNDGMLFEYDEQQPSTSTNVWLRQQNVSKPSASIKTDFTLGNTNYGAVAHSSATYTSGAAVKGNTTSMTWLKWAKDGTSACLSVFDCSAEGYSATSYAVSAIRYLALVYRSTGGSSTDTAKFDMWNNTDNARTSQMSVTYDNRGTSWRYMIVDLAKTGADLTDKVTAIYGYLPSGTGVAFAGYFTTEADAKTYGENALKYTGQTYHYAGDNRGFGLLRGSRSSAYSSQIISEQYADAGIHMANTYGDDATVLDVSTLDFGYDYKLHGTIGLKGIATLGLLEADLSEAGLPVYKEETVAYVADHLKNALAIPEIDSSTGYRNYEYVQGAINARYGNIDLAQWLRNHCTSMGSYAASSAKNLVGAWDKVSGNITTWYDAAYFMLNSIFVGGSYNDVMTDYDYLVLSAATNTDGQKVYVFDGGFATSATPENGSSAVKYDEDANTIQNSSAAGKTRYYYDSTNTTTYYPLLPIVDEKGNNTNGITSSPYFLDPGVSSTTKDGNTYVNRNFNYVMASNGEFVFYKDDELYFTFEGDDDVYLFIDGKLVLDIGGAHSITNYKMNVNDYADVLGLEDGNTYSFDFYYMERHGVGANMRIETNIRVTDPSMNTTKTAWQGGTQIDFGSIVDKDKVIEYGFDITNNGEENLYNLTFTDNDIGVTLDYTNGLKVTGSRVYDVNGGTLEVTDLTAVISHPDYSDINVTFANNDALKTFLTELTASGTEAGGGLFEKATVQIRGIGYKMSPEQIEAGVFDNTVLTTATNKTKSKALHGQATMRVFVPADPMYYQWAGHELKITKEKLVADVLEAAGQADNILNGKVPNLTADRVTNIVEVTKGGYANDYSAVTVNSDYSLTVNYTDVGSYVFYVKVYYKVSDTNWPNVVIPIVVNVTDVQDSVYVLDYGLKVDLTAGGELTKNDTLTVPGRATTNSILGIGSNGSYTPNEITFTTAAKVEGTYGDFAYADQTITYSPKAFLEGFDVVQVAQNVYESDITPSKITGELNINDEVEMYKNILVLPANVVYYEDDFPAITYTSTETDETYTNVLEKVGSSANKTQSNNQNDEYGSDDVYAEDDEYSGNSLTKITINEKVTAASFTFKGTGFELIGRTNATDSATLIVKVKDSTGNVVKNIPVITEFDNGDDGGSEGIYQVPVIRVKDLSTTAQTYTVEISGVPANVYDENGNKTGTKETFLYIDGLRIYQPVEGDTATEKVDGEDKTAEDLYNETEQDAQFLEIRNQIMDGKVAVAQYSDTAFKVSTGTATWTENLNGELEYNQVESVNEYLLKGPNNEVYMTGTYDNAALVFYVKETDANVHGLQIALRGIDETLFMSGIESAVNATVRVGAYTNGEYAWTDVVTETTSSTEQYYSIDYTKCFLDTTKGAYQVVIRVDDGMVSYSSLKLTGLELVDVNGEATNLYYVNGILSTYYNELPSGENKPESNNEVSEVTEGELNGQTVAASNEASVITEGELTGETVAASSDVAVVNDSAEEKQDDTSDVTYVEVDASTYVNFYSVKQQMQATTVLSDEEEPETPEVEDPADPEAPEVEDPTDPETPEVEDPTEPETPDVNDPTEPEEDDHFNGIIIVGNKYRQEMIKKMLGYMKNYWGKR